MIFKLSKKPKTILISLYGDNDSALPIIILSEFESQDPRHQMRNSLRQPDLSELSAKMYFSTDRQEIRYCGLFMPFFCCVKFN